MERRLSAILAADMVGYSRLMEADEVGVLKRLKAYREELIDPHLTQYHGRIVKLMGDGLLVEFPSVIEAVQCAVDIQTAVTEREINLPEDQQIAFRIGINLGDIVVDEEDIYGDGVNIAARLESLSDPGGICISGPSYDQMRSLLDVSYESLGEVKVKNLKRKIRVYRVLFGDGQPGSNNLKISRSAKLQQSPFRFTIIGLLLIAAVSTGAVMFVRPQIWDQWIGGANQQIKHPSQSQSIAVFPLRFRGESEEDSYLAEGISEDVLTNISQSADLLVIAPSGSTPQQSNMGQLRQTAQEFEATYMITGSFRRDRDLTRINVQLVNVENGESLWAKVYEPNREELVRLSEVITDEALSSIPNFASLKPAKSTERKPHFPDPKAYDHLLHGNVLFSTFSIADLRAARDWYTKAIEIDPNYARPRANFAFTLALEVGFGWSEDPGRDTQIAESYLEEAIRLDPNVHQAYLARGLLLRARRHYAESIKSFAKAIEISPNNADAYSMQSLTFVFAGKHQAGLEAIENAMRRSTDLPFFYLHTKAMTLFHLERYQESVEYFNAALTKNPDFLPARLGLASVLAKLGRREDAEWEFQEVLVRLPDFSLLREQARAPYADTNDLLRYMDGLKIAAGE